MDRYYDITIKDKDKNGSISYWADSFSIDENGILRVKSRECGDITVQIELNESLSVSSVDVKDEYDEMMEVENKKPDFTNADRIRQMTDEELAEFLLKVNTAYAEPCMVSGGDCKYEDYPTHDKGCKDCFLEYLRKEVEG